MAKKPAPRKSGTSARSKSARPASRTAPKKKAPAKKAAPARKAAASKKTAPARKAAAPKKAAPARKAAAPKKAGNPSGTVRAAMPSSLAKPPASTGIDTGRAELRQKVRQHTSTSPALTGGDVDADWGRADTVGDEAPGGDNPTPDQDVVDEIGRALGVEYDDDEELRGGDEIADRDRHRWELDPESSEDFDDR